MSQNFTDMISAVDTIEEAVQNLKNEWENYASDEWQNLSCKNQDLENELKAARERIAELEKEVEWYESRFSC